MAYSLETGCPQHLVSESKTLTGERDSWRAWDGHVHTAIFKMSNQQEPTIQHRKLSSVRW